MNAITFDTHIHIKRLKEKGAPEPLAEAFVEMVKEARETDMSALATKADLAELRAEIKADQTELIKWMFTGFVSLGGLLITILLTILFKLH